MKPTEVKITASAILERLYDDANLNFCGVWKVDKHIRISGWVFSPYTVKEITTLGLIAITRAKARNKRNETRGS